MKRKLMFLTSVMLILSVISFGIVKVSGGHQKIEEDKITIVTSFYPMYIIALNLTEHLDNVEVINLTDNNVGCLHDYQLTTKDMRTLNDADILILNGGDMEIFLEDVVDKYPMLKVINASEHVSFLEGIEHVHGEELSSNINHGSEEHTEDINTDANHVEESHTEENETSENHAEDEHTEENETSVNHAEDEHSHDHNQDSHVHSDINGHVWLDMNRYLVQIETIAKELEMYDRNNADIYRENAETYKEKVNLLKNEFEDVFSELEGLEIVAFHGAFAYLADELSFEMIHSLDMDSDTVLSAGEIATVIEEVKHHKVQYLFAEEQYSKDIANRISEETNAKVCLLETLVSGDLNKDAYLVGMQKNLKALQSMLLTQ